MNSDPKKPLITPKIKMRRFNWTKVAYKAAVDTFWEKLDESHIKVHPDELEKLFGVAKKKEAEIEPVSKPKVVHLLESRRSQNISIVLSSHTKISLETLVEAVHNLDESIITPNHSFGLSSSCPTAEEMEQLKGYTGDVGLLDRPERYILLVSTALCYSLL